MTDSSVRHPFAGRKGAKQRDAFKAALYLSQEARCKMCGEPLGAELTGKDCHVDHIRPWRLRPDLAYALDNLQLVCPACHNGTCAAIEDRFEGDADRIAEAKAQNTFIGADGWRI